MATDSLSAAPGVDFVAAGEVATGAKLQEGFTGLVGGNFSRNHVNTSTTSFITKSATPLAAPVIGEFRAPGDGTLLQYLSAGWTTIGFETSATVPATTTVGSGWNDTTLGLTRIYMTWNGLTGWHPVSSGVVLAKNKSGSDVDSGRVVVRKDFSSPDVVPEFLTTTAIKDQSVYGVTIEDIANGDVGVVATVESGAIVDLYVLGASLGPIAIGEVLATHEVAGVSRPVDTGTATAHLGADARSMGLVMGGFAIAKQATALDATIKVKLLGKVGNGATVFLPSPTNAFSTSTSGTPAGVELTGLATNHIMTSAILEVTFDGTAAGGIVDYELALGPYSPPVSWVATGRVGGLTAAAQYKIGGMRVEVQTSNNVLAVSSDDIGNWISHECTENTGTGFSYSAKLIGYRH